MSEIKMIKRAFGHDSDKNGAVRPGKWYEKGETYTVNESLAKSFSSVGACSVVCEGSGKKPVEVSNDSELVDNGDEEPVKKKYNGNKKASSK